MNSGAWQATVHRVSRSWTGLKQLSTHTHTHTHTQNKKIEKKEKEKTAKKPTKKQLYTLTGSVARAKISHITEPQFPFL